MIVGEGQYRYEVMADWEQLPSGWVHGDVAGIATDSQDRVYVFNRSEHPVIVYDQDGKFLDTWGDDTVYPRPHGITIVRTVDCNAATCPEMMSPVCWVEPTAS